MQLPAIPKRLTIRYLVEQADDRLRAQIFHCAYAGYPCIASTARIQITPYSIASRNGSLPRKSNKLVTFRWFVFPTRCRREKRKTQKHIL
jgi:hypothetical protein